MSLTYAEFCAGYGGLGLAVEEVFDAELKWYSEFEAAPSKIMAHHWPGIPNHGDMTTIDFTQVEPVDILSGGTPCQDLSTAGRRAGMTEGTRSNLAVQFLEAVATIKPRFVVWENVRGAYSAGADSAVEQCAGCMGDAGDGQPLLRALGRVLGGLSDLGYDCQWRGLRAADVGAPHGRFRVFILATHRDHIGSNGAGQWAEQDGRGQPADGGVAAADTDSRNDYGRFDVPEREALKRASTSRRCETVGRVITADADDAGSQGQHHQAGTSPAKRHRHSSEGVDWREYAGAVRRWEALHGAAPAPVELGPTGKPRLSPHLTEWMMGLPAGWITDVPGISWGDQLKAAGNGVVPHQAAAALRDMLNHQETK